MDHVVGVGHHSDQQVEEHNDVDHVVRAVHEHGPEPREGAQAHQLEGVQFNETERGPKQGLGGLEQAAGVRTRKLVRGDMGERGQTDRYRGHRWPLGDTWLLTNYQYIVGLVFVFCF